VTPHWWTRDLGVGASGPAVWVVRRKLGQPAGSFDEQLAALVRGFQVAHRLVPTGVVDARTACLLGEPVEVPLPDWFERTVLPGEAGYLGVLSRLGFADEGELRRTQGTLGVTPTGVVDENLLRLLGVHAQQ